MVTICRKCKHITIGSTKKYHDIPWYYFTCKKFKPEPELDYVTGKPRQEEAFCRDYNTDGKCSGFEEK